VYGLPEIYREKIRTAKLVANPGCYPTATALALKPLLDAKLIQSDSITIDAKSGVSGAGRAKHSLEFHFPELNENMRAYGIAGTHRHTPEIEQTLGSLAGEELFVSFTPHLIPVSRGIISSSYAVLNTFKSTAELIQLYRTAYEHEPFVQVSDTPLGTKAASGTNTCFVTVASDTRTGRVTAIGVIDNLIKGAAGQAVQNMNLMLGFDEQSGLNQGGVWP
jgi:N-acetyl-gamma-glutamyl-phosphate reductase